MCLICDRISMIKNGSNNYFVKELETGYVVIGDHQFFKGYTVFLCKSHQSELSMLDREFKLKFLEEMAIVAEAVQNATGVPKMNYEMLGNGDAHMHWHLFPRRENDLGEYGVNGRGPVWLYPMEKMYDEANRPTEEELKELKDRLLIEINKLI